MDARGRDIQAGEAPLRRDGPGAGLAAWIAAAVLLVVGGIVLLTPHEWSAYFLRDLPVYRTAVDTFAAGGDPYQAARGHHGGGLFFTSPPFVWALYRGAALAGLGPLVPRGLIIAGIVAILATPLILARLLLGERPAQVALGFAVFFAAFAGQGFFSALAMNNGTPLYALIALSLAPAVLRGRWVWFHLAVILATAFKPYYAAFWLVPVLADGVSLRQLLASIVGFVVAAFTYLAAAITAPALFGEWLHTLSRQTLVDGLLGSNLFAAVFHQPFTRHHRAAPYEAQFALSALLLLLSVGLLRTDRRRRIAGLVLAAVFLDPRLMPYDLCIAAIPLLAALAGASLWAQTLWAVALTIVMAIAHQPASGADGFVYPALAVIALVVADLAPGRAAAPLPAPDPAHG